MGNRVFMVILGIAVGYYFLSHKEEPPQEPEFIEEQEEVQDEPVPEPKKSVPLAKPSTVLKAPPPPKPGQNVKYPQVTKEFAPFDAEGNMYVTKVMVDGERLVYHGDVLLGEKKDLKKYLKQGEIKRAKPEKWGSGTIPYEIDPNLPNPDRAVDAIDYMNNYTNLNFVERDEQKDFLFITTGNSNCYSYVGKVGGWQPIYLSGGCGTREILHELMHSIGFFHEQNREDRDDYVTIYWGNIHEDHLMQFKKLPNEYMSVEGRPFDFDSIMLYSSRMFSVDPNEPSITGKSGELFQPEPNQYLSPEDIERVNISYPEPQ